MGACGPGVSATAPLGAEGQRNWAPVGACGLGVSVTAPVSAGSTYGNGEHPWVQWRLEDPGICRHVWPEGVCNSTHGCGEHLWKWGALMGAGGAPLGAETPLGAGRGAEEPGARVAPGVSVTAPMGVGPPMGTGSTHRCAEHPWGEAAPLGAGRHLGGRGGHAHGATWVLAGEVMVTCSHRGAGAPMGA